MTITIIEALDINLTRSEHDRLQREWQKSCQYHVAPPSFEDYVRSRVARMEENWDHE